jgi:anti-anti-sigma regulatory factor
MAAELSLTTDRGPDGMPRLTATGEIDLSTVKYLDSAGINALFNHADKVDRLHIIVHRLLIRVLTICGLDKVATLEAAPAPTGGDG